MVGRGGAAARPQVGAIVWRPGEHGAPEVLLLTSRETGRWVIPKGWPMKGKKGSAAAAQEALEEAGVLGRVGKEPVGAYTYFKRQRDRFDVCNVSVYLIAFERQLPKWPEKGQRQSRWFPLEEAALRVQEPGLSALLDEVPVKLDPLCEAKPPRGG